MLLHDFEAETSRLSGQFSYQGHYSPEDGGENHRHGGVSEARLRLPLPNLPQKGEIGTNRFAKEDDNAPTQANQAR